MRRKCCPYCCSLFHSSRHHLPHCSVSNQSTTLLRIPRGTNLHQETLSECSVIAPLRLFPFLTSKATCHLASNFQTRECTKPRLCRECVIYLIITGFLPPSHNFGKLLSYIHLFAKPAASKHPHDPSLCRPIALHLVLVRYTPLCSMVSIYAGK